MTGLARQSRSCFGRGALLPDVNGDESFMILFCDGGSSDRWHFTDWPVMRLKKIEEMQFAYIHSFKLLKVVLIVGFASRRATIRSWRRIHRARLDLCVRKIKRHYAFLISLFDIGAQLALCIWSIMLFDSGVFVLFWVETDHLKFVVDDDRLFGLVSNRRRFSALFSRLKQSLFGSSFQHLLSVAIVTVVAYFM